MILMEDVEFFGADHDYFLEALAYASDDWFAIETTTRGDSCRSSSEDFNASEDASVSSSSLAADLPAAPPMKMQRTSSTITAPGNPGNKRHPGNLSPSSKPTKRATAKRFFSAPPPAVVTAPTVKSPDTVENEDNEEDNEADGDDDDYDDKDEDFGQESRSHKKSSRRSQGTKNKKRKAMTSSIKAGPMVRQTSLFRGVSCCGKDRKFQARIRDGNQVHYLGRCFSFCQKNANNSKG